MNKQLEKMSLKELWQLFPIFLVEHNKEWIKWYEEERKTILLIVPSKSIKRISHIGSSAISGIWAKNIVDMLVEVNDKEALDMVKHILINNGWLCMKLGSH